MIYKISDQAAWDFARQAGIYAGSPDDLRDGYIHFSTASQLAGTLAKYYAGRCDLVLVAVDPAILGSDLKWEPARGGVLFPHLHAPLAMTGVAWVRPITLGADGRQTLPDGVI
jgi:uncharacterized protein (DUF952 family)